MRTRVSRASRTRRDDLQPTETRRRSRRVGIRRLLGWAVFLPLAGRAPLYLRLFWELVRDERMPAGRKALLGGALAYLVLGRDLVSDDVPVVGGLDDLVVVVLAVDLFLDGVPGALLTEKLEELGIDERAFRDDVARIRRFTPRSLRRLVRQVPGTVAFVGDAYSNSGIGPRVRSWINKEGSIA
jgi:uncharacterized membrane protein YkvA (DUF1232 family)